MKKILKIVGISLCVILLLLLATPFLFKGKIETIVKDKVNEQLNARVDWSRIGLTFFRGFPDLSISLHQVSVVGVDAFAGDTLAGLQRFEIRVNPFSALGKNLEVNAILIDQPMINGMVLEDGKANWDIMEASSTEGEKPGEAETGSEKSMSVSLKRFILSGGRIYYHDAGSDLDASMEGLSIQMRGDLSMDQSDLEISANIDRLYAKMGGIPYLRDAIFQMDLLASANLEENIYTLKENLIQLNGLALGTEGDIRLPEDDAMVLNLNFFSRKTDFKTLLSLIPAVYLNDFETLETSGSLELNGSLSGLMKDSILPDASLNLQVKDGYFSYPQLPGEVSDVQIDLKMDYRGGDMDASRVDLERFHMLLGGNPFDMQMQVDHPVSDMHVAGNAKGEINFATLQDVVPLEDVSFEGRLETDLSWDALMSQIDKEQYEEVDLEGLLMVKDMELHTPELPVPLILEEVFMLFNPRYVELRNFDLKLGSSDLHVQGELENFIPYLFDGQTLRGSLAASSTFLNASELLPEEGDVPAGQEEVLSDSIVPVAPDSLAKPFQIKIPENVDFSVYLDAGRLEYRDIVIENIAGTMQMTGGVAALENLRMDAIDGSMVSRGWIDTRGDYAETDIYFEVQDIDISSAYETFISVKKLIPMAKFVKGRANVNMTYHSLLDNTFTPLFGTINARGKANTRGLQFYGVEEFVPFSEVLKNEKFSEMAPDEVQVSFTVRDGRIALNPFDMDVYDSKIRVSGSHGLDLTMDYELDMDIAKSDLGAGANELIQGMTLLAAGAGLQIPQSDYVNVVARIGGTFNSPRITTDLTGNLKSSAAQVKAAVEERITEEVEQVEQQLREEAGKQAEEIIRTAESEADRLVEEARRAGDKLVEEAEAQGKKLMDEAGSNPLKQVAARTAANELVRQAEKQSENLLLEAERKGAEIIEKAREEASRL